MGLVDAHAVGMLGPHTHTLDDHLQTWHDVAVIPTAQILPAFQSHASFPLLKYIYILF